MSKSEFEGVLAADRELFEELIMRFYKKPLLESYSEFKKEIEERFRRKDTNPKYRSAFATNLDDLVMSVVLRFIRVNSRLHKAGKEIESVPAMLENRIGHVYHEELRRLSRLESSEFHESHSPAQTKRFDLEIEEAEETALRNLRYKECLKELPPHILNTFLEYYGVQELTPLERTRARRQLALRVAKLPFKRATPEELEQATRNLQSKICKWRKEHLKPCMDKDLKRISLHH